LTVGDLPRIHGGTVSDPLPGNNRRQVPAGVRRVEIDASVVLEIARRI
jgi:hypothetical protein